MTQAVEPNDVSTELIALSEQVHALADTGPVVEALSDSLNYLYETGADARALETVHANASTLLDTTQQLNQAFGAAMKIAQLIRQQRDQTQQALVDLKKAMAVIDTDVPEVEELFESVEQITIEGVQDDMWVWMWDFVHDQITAATPLNWFQADILTTALTSGMIPQNDPLWTELLDWLERAEHYGEDS